MSLVSSIATPSSAFRQLVSFALKRGMILTVFLKLIETKTTFSHCGSSFIPQTGESTGRFRKTLSWSREEYRAHIFATGEVVERGEGIWWSLSFVGDIRREWIMDMILLRQIICRALASFNPMTIENCKCKTRILAYLYALLGKCARAGTWSTLPNLLPKVASRSLTTRHC